MKCPDCGHELPVAAKFCPNCGTRIAELAVEDGERRHATIMFSDLSGYTALNERLDPEEVEAIMGRIKREATRVIAKHGGVINQFIGDEVVALFGIPVARRDDPGRAVRAARELHAAVRCISDELATRIGCALTMHSGINTGLIVTRRSDSRDGHFALTGDTVNTGARLLGLAAADEIVIGPDTWREVSAQFSVEIGDPIEVRGKAHRVTPYRVRDERSAHSAGRPPIVGRSDELRNFAAMVTACVERRAGGVILVRGDPGIGKTRLLAEYSDIALTRGFSCHAAQVLDFSAGLRGDAIRNLARGLLELDASAEPECCRTAIADAISGDLLGKAHELFLCDLLDVLPRTDLAGLDAALTGAARDQGTLAAMIELARAAAKRRPLLLLVEDVHWADAWTLERLAAIARVTSESAALLALTTRIEGDPTRTGWRDALCGAALVEVDMAPLSTASAVELASRFSGLDADTARSIIERAEGNPLFLEQLLLSAGESATLPGSIQSLVLARMDQLPAVDRHTFQAASILGQRFSLDALRHLVDNPACDCSVLVEHQLMRSAGPDCQFSHALIRDGAYESLLKSRRRQLHARAAEWFEARELDLCAEHFERAGDARAPRAYLAAAAAEALRYRYQSALTLVESGFALASARVDCYALGMLRARVMLDSGQARDSISAAGDALQHATGAAERAGTLTLLAAGMRIVERVADAMAALDEAEPLAREAGSHLELARLHHLRGGFYFGLGRSDECLREHEASLAAARAAGSIEAEANALSGLGDANYVRGRMRTAHERFGACVSLARGNGLGRIEVANSHMMAWTLHFLGRLDPALAILRDAIALTSQVSARRTELAARQSVAYIEGWLMGQVDAAQEQLEQAMTLARTLGARRFEAQNMIFRAMVLLRRGRRADALDLARSALDFCRDGAMEFIGPTVLGFLAQAAGDSAERLQALADGEALLAKGSLSHNYFAFYASAIEACVEASDHAAVDRYCDALERYVGQEPVLWSELAIARGRLLARAVRGEHGEHLVQALEGQREKIAQSGFTVWIPGIDAALQRMGKT